MISVMRYDTLRAFVKHLQGAAPKHLASSYLLVTKNNYERNEAYRQLINAVFTGASPGENRDVKLFSAAGLKLSELRNELDTISFFSPKRMVVLQQAEKLTSDFLRGMESYIGKASPGVTFVIMGEAMAKSCKCYTEFDKHGIILDIPELKPWQKEQGIQQWIKEKVAADGRQIEHQAAVLLLQQIGCDQELLHHELEKLYCYIGDRTVIALHDVAAISSVASVENVWKLGESIFSFDAATAMRTAKGLLDEGVALLTLLRQIRSQFETEFQICTFMVNGKGREEVVQHFPYMKGAILNKHLENAQNYGAAKFKRGLLAIDRTELQAKNSNASEDCLLEALIAKLSTR